MTIDFDEFIDKVKFNSDTDFVVEQIKTENVRNYRIFVNGTLIYHQDGFKIKNNDEIKIKIFPYEVNKKSVVYLQGYNPNKIFESNNVTEKVSDEIEKFEDIKIE